MISNTTNLKINATVTRIISGAIIAVGISMLISNAVMTTSFIMGIALSIMGAAIIVLAQRQPLKLASEKLTK
jgi:hypothetical protein